jgi:hypothetical protein
MRIATSLSVAAVAGLFATACSILAPGCTLRGCGPSLTVELTATPASPFRIEALAVGSDDRRVFECLDVRNCVAGAWFQDFTPEEVVIRVTTEAGSAEHTVRPVYETHRPNGPRCEPVCRQATVRVPLPD